MSTTIRIAVSLCLALVLVLGATVIAFGDTGGSATYAQYCAGCHGSNGQGSAYGPDIQGESAGEVIDVTRSGDDEMPAYDSTVISDTELEALAAFVSALSGSTAPGDQYGDGGNDDTSAGGAPGDQYGEHGDGDSGSADDNSSEDAAGDQYAGYNLELICGSVYWANWDDYTNQLLSVDYGITNNGSGAAHHVYIESATANNGVTASWFSARSWDEITPGETVNFTIKWLVPANVGTFVSTLEVCAGCANEDNDSDDHGSDDSSSDDSSDDRSDDHRSSRYGDGDHGSSDGGHYSDWRKGSRDEGSRDD